MPSTRELLETILIEAGFYSAPLRCSACGRRLQQGRLSLPPGCYFRMHVVGYSRGSTASVVGSGAVPDSLSLRVIDAVLTSERAPYHTSPNKTRSRLPLEVHEAMFNLGAGAAGGSTAVSRAPASGVDASTMEANAALRAIVRRDSGEDDREMLHRLARASGTAMPMADALIRLDRRRKGKRPSNVDWTSPSDPQAKVAKLKDGRPARQQARVCGRPRYRGHRRGGGSSCRSGHTTTLPQMLQAAELTWP